MKNSLVCLVLAALMVCASASHRRMLIEGGKWIKGANGEDIYQNPPQDGKSCTNVAPDQRFTCEQQKSFGACDAEFMKKGNYCLYTCGRCPSGGQEEKGEKKESTSGQGSGSKGSSTGFAKPGNPNICDDIQPNQQYTCQQQRDFGKCREWYIVDNHFCAKTCGLSPCAPVANLPKRNGTSTSIAQRNTTTATPALEAVNATTPVAVVPVVATPVVTGPPIAGSVTPANATVVAPEANVTAPEANVTAPEANVTAPTATVAPTDANVTAPEANVTAPTVNATAPEATVAAPAVVPAVFPTGPVVTTTAPLASPALAPVAAVAPTDANATAPVATATPTDANVTAPALSTGNFTEPVGETSTNATLTDATLVNATLASPVPDAANATLLNATVANATVVDATLVGGQNEGVANTTA